MDGLTAGRNYDLIRKAGSIGSSHTDRNLARECRNLIAVLSQNVETLCSEHHEDCDRVRHIRSLADSFGNLSALLNVLEQEIPGQGHHAVFEDEQGITYQSVRSCDLEQWFSIK